MAFSKILTLIYVLGAIVGMVFALNDPYYINRAFTFILNIGIIIALVNSLKKNEQKHILNSLMLVSLTQLFAVKFGKLSFVNILGVGVINYLRFDGEMQIQTFISSSFTRIFSGIADDRLFFGVNFVSVLVLLLIMLNYPKIKQNHGHSL